MPFVEPVNIVCSTKTDLDYDLEFKRNDTDLAQSIQNPFSPQSPLSPRTPKTSRTPSGTMKAGEHAMLGMNQKVS